MAYVPVRLPITDMTGHLFTRQSRYDTCRDFEYNFIHCAETYGVPRLTTKCKDLFDDLSECQYRFKQNERIQAMEKERAAQYRRGEIDKKYKPDPRHDIWNAANQG